MSANVNYYVRTDGSDSNDGSANTAGSAFLTVQKAINVALERDWGTNGGDSYKITINIAAGTYAQSLSVSKKAKGQGFQRLTLQGASAATTIIDSSVALYVYNLAQVQVSDLTLDGSSECIEMGLYASVRCNSCNLINGGSGIHVYMSEFCHGTFTSCVFSGNSSMCFYLDVAHCMVNANSCSVSGTPAFGQFLYAEGHCHFQGNAWTGSATGQRFSLNGNCSVTGSVSNAFTNMPGSTDGDCAGNSNYGSLLADMGKVVITDKSANYTLVAADALNKLFRHPAADNNARTFTIPANSSVPFPVGTVVPFHNEINTLSIAITTDTMTLIGAGSTGTRTLAANGFATATKVASTSWIIQGTGLS
jgi:hypothetical protein